ncbi:DMT family transporter [Thaumasiovibrio subtropicus]|uniref:DMT family transporter n=1 Tax=Thaumasiovibrio subtropicus TaxID=1891207 RepID=UPI000B3588EF|nr:DMT family transporter [Thaumasiovibrio subtropicus]
MYHFLALFTVLLWGGNTIANRMAAGVIEPGAMSFYRWFVAFLVLTPFCLPAVWRKRHQIKPHLGKIAILAGLGMVLNQTLGYYAAHTTTATNMALIMALVPLLSLFMSAQLLGQRIKGRALVGTAISLGGLAFMLSRGELAQLFSQGMVLGDALMLGAATTYALYCVLLKRWSLAFLTSWQMVYVQVSVAVLLLMPLLFNAQSQAISADALPIVLYAGLAISVLAPWLWIRSIERLGAGNAAMYMNFLPVFSALLASIMLDEQLTVFHAIGMPLVLGGVIIAQIQRLPGWWRKEEQRQEEVERFS